MVYFTGILDCLHLVSELHRLALIHQEGFQETYETKQCVNITQLLKPTKLCFNAILNCGIQWWGVSCILEMICQMSVTQPKSFTGRLDWLFRPEKLLKILVYLKFSYLNSAVSAGLLDSYTASLFSNSSSALVATIAAAASGLAFLAPYHLPWSTPVMSKNQENNG